jgi:phage gp46-like protein
MRRRFGGYLNPIVLIGLALSLALGLVFDLTGAARGPESVIAGLLGVVITLVLDASARAEERFELQPLLRSPVRDEIRELAAVVDEIEQRQPAPEVTTELSWRVRELRRGLSDLRDGRIVRPGHDMRTLLTATDDCRERMEAVTNLLSSGTGGVSWWRSAAGRRYWAANLAALARGVTVTRIFIVAELDDEAQLLIEEQRAAGVEVITLPRRDVHPDLHVNVVLWDRRRAWTADMSAQGRIRQHVVCTDGQAVRLMCEAFDSCLGSARR